MTTKLRATRSETMKIINRLLSQSRECEGIRLTSFGLADPWDDLGFSGGAPHEAALRRVQAVMQQVRELYELSD